MEVRFTPETERKLADLAAQSGIRPDDLVEDATASWVDELLQTRVMLDSRYDDMKNGSVTPISRAEMLSWFSKKSAARRVPPGS